MMTQRDSFLRGDMPGGYEILTLIGSGGHAEVYRAIAPSGQRVAIKILQESMRGSPKIQQRFVNEARVLRELVSEYIVRFIDFGLTSQGAPWFAMELLEGTLLREEIHDRGGRLDVERAFLIARQIARAAHVAHWNKIYHRDLKPENVMLLGGDRVKVFDFGIAKLRGWGNKTTLPTDRCGTPLYMAPEQIAGEDTDAWTDVYAIGVILYECMAGRTPFGGADGVHPTLEQLGERQRRGAKPLEAILPGLPPYVWKAVEKALRYEPRRRYQTAAELVGALGRVVKRWRLEHRRTTSVLPRGPVGLTPPPDVTLPPGAVPAPAAVPTPPPGSGKRARTWLTTVPVDPAAPSDPRPPSARGYAKTVPIAPGAPVPDPGPPREEAPPAAATAAEEGARRAPVKAASRPRRRKTRHRMRRRRRLVPRTGQEHRVAGPCVDDARMPFLRRVLEGIDRLGTSRAFWPVTAPLVCLAVGGSLYLWIWHWPWGGGVMPAAPAVTVAPAVEAAVGSVRPAAIMEAAPSGPASAAPPVGSAGVQQKVER